MHDQANNIEIDNCPNCGSKLEYGFLIGKQNRIRWACSTKGMTIFHGVPLIKLKEGFWKNWKWWFYAPNIPAQRCSVCHLVIFAYNNDAKENFRNEFWASVVFSWVTFFVAILLGFIAFVSFLIEPAISIFLRLSISIASIILLLLGVIFGTCIQIKEIDYIIRKMLEIPFWNIHFNYARYLKANNKLIGIL